MNDTFDRCLRQKLQKRPSITAEEARQVREIVDRGIARAHAEGFTIEEVYAALIEEGKAKPANRLDNIGGRFGVEDLWDRVIARLQRGMS